MTTHDERTQVLVVGGALTGLSAALFLAARGVDVLLVERHRDLLSHPRLRGITPRTVEVYRELGLEDAIRERSFLGGGAAFVPLRAETLAGEHQPVQEAEDEDVVDPRRYSPCAMASIDQDQLEEILRAKAREFGAQMRFSTELVSFTQDSGGVTATLRDRADGSERIARADYLVGADGTKSCVRTALGIESDGPGVLFDTVTAMVHVDLRAVLRGRRVGIAYLQKPRPFSTMMPHDDAGTEWLFSTGMDTTRESLADFTDDRVSAMVREAAGAPDADVTLRPQIPGTDVKVLGFPIGARVAREYGRDRVFLAGDAARIQPPTGGFGGSTGVQDAHNLAWKLAAVLAGWARPALLATYQQERQPYGTVAMQQAFARFGDRMAGGAEVEMLDHAAVTAGFGYRSAAVLGGSGNAQPVHPAHLAAEPGTRAPHRELPDGRSTLDLFGDGFVLLTTMAVLPEWSEAAEKVAAELGASLRTYPLPDGVAETYRLGRSGEAAAVLVRPDGFVAWRSPGGPAEPSAGLAVAMRTVLGRCDV